MVSCSDDDEPQIIEETNIVDIASDTEDLSILVQAVQQAGLVDALTGPGPLTVFAPTNAAFQQLLDSNPAWNSLSDIDNTTLTNVLLFHVLSGDVKSTDLSDMYVPTLSTRDGNEAVVLQVDVTGGISFNGTSNPISTDIEASNGTIHIIDEVMLPPSIVTLALNNSNFTSLVAALTRPDLTTDYVSILNGDGPFTVFAPTNAAFQSLLDSNDAWTSLNDIPVDLLEAVLNYHVIGSANVQSSQLVNDQQIEALGGMLQVDLDSGAALETTSGQTVNIVITDVQGTNGVVHAVDQVLLP